MNRARPRRRALAFAVALMLAPIGARAQALTEERVAEASVAGAIRSAVGGKLKAFYRPRGYWPLWIQGGAPGPQADRFVALVESAALDGLDPKDYDPSDLRDTIAQTRGGSPEALARAELKLSRTFAAYVRDMRRAPAARITYLDRELIPERRTDAETLRVAALAPSFADYVDGVGWMSPIYVRLRGALVDYRARWDGLPRIAIPAGAPLRAGVKGQGDRVRALRRRLGLPEGAAFDKALAARLRAFQADHGLPANGIVDEETITALDRAPDHYERILQLNLDRARVLPGPWVRNIVVDAASARLWMYRDGKEEGTMRVIVGKPTEQTPMLAGMVRYAILNPYWNVPTDLVEHRVAPKVLAGATLASMNYEALSDWSAGARPLDPAEIDWSAVAAGRTELRLRQLPGGANAMGKMKFMFPNDLGIYLHDTPDKALFAEKERWFSSGCVRLEDAPRLAKWLFGQPPTPPSDAPEQQMPLPAAVPVYLSYFTAMPTGTGISFFKDGYGRDEIPAER